MGYARSGLSSNYKHFVPPGLFLTGFHKVPKLKS